MTIPDTSSASIIDEDATTRVDRGQPTKKENVHTMMVYYIIPGHICLRLIWIRFRVLRDSQHGLSGT